LAADGKSAAGIGTTMTVLMMMAGDASFEGNGSNVVEVMVDVISVEIAFAAFVGDGEI
jgi:hypothetical protein